jgi:hypothetical protein
LGRPAPRPVPRTRLAGPPGRLPASSLGWATMACWPGRARPRRTPEPLPRSMRSRARCLEGLARRGAARLDRWRLRWPRSLAGQAGQMGLGYLRSVHAPGLSSIDTRSIKGGCSAFKAKANYVSTWNARLAGYKRIRSGACRGDFLISLFTLFCPSLTRYFAFLLPPHARRRSPARIYCDAPKPAPCRS